MLSKGQELGYAGLIIFTGALWFARTDQETKNHWFNGFPVA
jgi:phosphatidylcholine synthase